MARIPDSFLQDLLARTDLVEIIDARVPLKKTGRNYSACCPFHNEKTPSFTVAPDKQFYYCFGCGAKGNALGFLMEYEHLGFPEAVKQLADRAGVEVPREQEDAASRQRKSHIDSLLELLERADRFYRQQLKSAAERQPAVDYLKARGLSGQVAARFGLGFAPPGFDNLIRELSLDEAGLALALEGGLLVRREDTGRTYDKFRERVMFPIRDSRGRTIGFGGRVLGDAKPKYLNSPETPVFHKGRELYGLWEWRQSRDQAKQLFVVEGYMDVIALAQYGVPNVVATLGTATTEDHAGKLFRQVDEVVFCFDGDNAGRRAAWRALESVLGVLEDGKQARFLFLPDGDDPDSLVRREGREGLLARADEAPPLTQFLFQHLEQDLDMGTLDGRARLARLALPYLQRTKGLFYRSLLRKELADRTRLTEDELIHLMDAPGTPGATSTPAAAPPPDYDMASMPPPDYGEPPPRYSGYGDEPDPEQRPRRRRRWRDRDEAPYVREPIDISLGLAEQLTLVLIHHPGLLADMPLPEQIEELELPRLDLLLQVAARLHDQPDLPPAALLGSIMAEEQGEDLSRLLRASLRPPMDDATARRYWRDATLRLRIADLQRTIRIAQGQVPPDVATLAALHQELSSARLALAEPLQ
ncbi:DNA primase [Isoalcanivorax beigongshangi]|uniref:DNA primase n=1 Tax=Isoalcanivorax beigongshangi TaxID=3238810 RepID=A0ABV4AEC4_9GAMM